jgi:hypothetical protein
MSGGIVGLPLLFRRRDRYAAQDAPDLLSLLGGEWRGLCSQLVPVAAQLLDVIGWLSAHGWLAESWPR